MGAPTVLREFERAYRTEAPYVAALMGRLAVPEEAISDAVQDVFVAAYRRWPDFDRTRAVRPWLTGFARRVAFRYRRSAARRHRRGAHLAVYEQGRAERAPDHQTDARDFLSRFLARIEPGHRRAFLLAEYEGMTAPEIAVALGISAEAVYGRVRATRRRLKQALMADLERPDRTAAAFVRPWSVFLMRLSLEAPRTLAATLGGASTAVVLKAAGIAIAGVVGLSVVAGASGATRKNTAPTVTVRSAGVQGPQRGGGLEDASDSTRPARPSAIPLSARVPAPVPSPVAESAAARPGPDDERGQASAETMAPATQVAGVAVESGDPAPMPTLSAETALLQAARRDLERGDQAVALQRLSEHARLYPQGQLADARRRARIRALCDLGHVGQARTEAEHMAASAPHDPLARQALSICSAPAIQNAASVEKSR